MGQDPVWGPNSTADSSGGPITATQLGYKRGFNTIDIPMATKIDEASATVTYVGKALLGSASSAAVWQIQKITVASTVTSITWADSDADFNNVWDDRASLTYG